ncbi:HAMP domain-containing histidine kinase [Mucilaginibacter mali]|uniref:histidine kinase n=1 Tax=Mucilaginibacter mali TaxID=2740462 RepID=A0A7D4ULC2_9SPHI|nr:HAMP domain-containing sensor histidine kinase [Mucilaginibacter mali]QKJ29641.1 HAMP domain-containing histidine kinase [Mucilaginibacter mali]
MSIQRKVALLFFALTSTVIILLSGAIFYFTHQFTFGDFYKRLEARVNLAAQMHQLNDKDSLGVYKEIRHRYLERLPNEQQYVLKQADYINKKPVHGVPAPFIATILEQGQARYKQGNVFYAGKITTMKEGRLIFIVSAADPYGLEELENLEKVLITGFLVSLVLVYFIGRRFSFDTFRPVRNIIKKVNTITASNLHLRLENYNSKDEVGLLTQTFNDMLDRLETAFETQNNFISNASHELRTPLAVIKGEAELALKQAAKTGNADGEALQQILKSAQSLQDILTSLLGLAQTGFDGKKQNWDLIRADELVWEIKASADQIVPGNNVRIDLSALPDDLDQLQILGNSNLLKLALSNIVLNACKYSENKEVLVKVSGENDRVIVSVKDEGIGIPEKDLGHIFEPFFRASNTGKFEGHGVGLPLALNIIRLHKGNIAIVSKENEGTDIRIVLPVYVA